MVKHLKENAMTEGQLKSGIRNIESIVISNVRERGGNITGKSFVWNHGVSKDRPPEIVSARITVNARTACLILPRECCEDSATVTRSEVCEAIDDCVRYLAEEFRPIERSDEIVA